MKRNLIVLIVGFFIFCPSFLLAKRQAHWHNKKWNTQMKLPDQEDMFDAFISDDSRNITLEFYERLGNVVICVLDSNKQVVYSEEISIIDAMCHNIPFSFPLKKDYSISITDGYNHAYGCFD